MKKKRRHGGVLPYFVLLLIFIIMFIVSSIKVIIYVVSSKENEKILDDIKGDITATTTSGEDGLEDTKYEVNFKNLKEKNPDTVGFLKVRGTDIASVVVKATNNDFYLAHNFERNYNNAGWIFADYRNKFDGNDKNIIIYGHNMRNGTMFASLKNVLDRGWMSSRANRRITLYTENGEVNYEVFSVYQIEAEDYYMKTNFQDGELKKYADDMKARSVYNFGVEVGDDDKVLTLSTCGTTNKFRIIVHAKQTGVSNHEWSLEGVEGIEPNEATNETPNT